MKEREKNNYILSGISFIIINIIICVLIYTKPKIMDWGYLLILFTVFIGWFIIFLSFPFMRKKANIKILSEKTGKLLIIGILVLFMIGVFIVYYNISNGKINIILLSVICLFCIGIINIIKEYFKFKNGKKKKKDKKG